LAKILPPASEFLRHVKYLTPIKEIKNSIQQIMSVESDIQSVKTLPPLETQCPLFKRLHYWKATRVTWTHFVLVPHLLKILLFSIMLWSLPRSPK